MSCPGGQLIKHGFELQMQIWADFILILWTSFTCCFVDIHKKSAWIHMLAQMMQICKFASTAQICVNELVP